MTALVRVGLHDGGELLLESVDAGPSGPVKAGIAASTVQDLHDSLRAVLRPVVEASREVLAELQSAGPDDVKVEFGVKLTVAAGAIVAKAGADCHFKVVLGWKRSDEKPS